MIFNYNNNTFVALGDDEFEIIGLKTLLLSKLRVTAWKKLPDLQQDIDKYGITIINS